MINLTLLIKRALEAEGGVRAVTEAVTVGDAVRDALLVETTDDRQFTVVVREITAPSL